MTNLLDFSGDATTQISATIKSTIVKAVDVVVLEQRKLQPSIAGKIHRSSVMSILLAEALEARNDG